MLAPFLKRLNHAFVYNLCCTCRKGVQQLVRCKAWQRAVRRAPFRLGIQCACTVEFLESKEPGVQRGGVMCNVQGKVPPYVTLDTSEGKRGEHGGERATQPGQGAESRGAMGLQVGPATTPVSQRTVLAVCVGQRTVLAVCVG